MSKINGTRTRKNIASKASGVLTSNTSNKLLKTFAAESLVNRKKRTK